MLLQKLLGTASASNPSDPFWDYVTLYVKVKNGVIADVSPSPKTLTLSGNASVSSAATLFGEQSIYFDGVGDFITAASALYINGTSSFTIDFWVQQLTGSAGEILTIGSNNLNLYHSTVLGVWTGTTRQVTDQVAYGVWNHYAIVRNGADVVVYLNGVSKVTFTLSTSFVSNLFYLMRNFSNSTQAKGYVHSLRITNGIARYTGNFAVPTSPFPTNATAAAPLSLSYVGSSAVNDTTISLPAGAQEGDLLVLFDRPVATTVTIPSGFTPIVDYDVNAGSNYSMGISYRVMQAGDSSVTTATSRKIMAAFRPNRSILTVGPTVTAQIVDSSSPKSTTVSTVAGSQTLTFAALTQSTGTTTSSPTGTNISTFHTSGGDVYLGAWFGINSTAAISATDSTPSLMKVFGFRLSLT